MIDEVRNECLEELVKSSSLVTLEIPTCKVNTDALHYLEQDSELFVELTSINEFMTRVKIGFKSNKEEI